MFSLLWGGGETRVGSWHDGSLVTFDAAISAEAIFSAWAKFRKGKRSRFDVMAFEHQLEENLFELQDDLITGSYRHGVYTPFQICDPKQRQIHKATVRDRVVHQLVVSAIEPLFERQFIYDSFSCRKGKGTHAAVTRLRTLLRRASCNNSYTVYALKCDIQKFFASVDHAVLRKLLKRHITDEYLMRLLDEIIDSHFAAPGKGKPLGNLTSQLIANIYLHELDYFVKHTLRRKYYVRYCDDFVILGNCRDELLDLALRIGNFLETHLALSLHPDKVAVHTWHQGIDFLGYVLKPHATLLRSKTRKRMIDRVNHNNLTSYLGLCGHIHGYQISRLIITKALTAEGVNHY